MVGRLTIAAAAGACLLAPLLVCSAGRAQPAPPAADFQKAMAAYHRMPDTRGTGPFPAIKAADPAFPGHVVYRPADLGKLGGRIFTVHMSDNDGTDEKHWMPGTGIIRWSAVIERLAAAGYEGPFVFEVRKFVASELMSCWQGLLERYLSGTDASIEPSRH